MEPHLLTNSSLIAIFDDVDLLTLLRFEAVIAVGKGGWGQPTPIVVGEEKQ